MGRRKSSGTRLRLFATLVVLLALVVAMHDYSVPPSQSISAKAGLLMIDQYRAHVSPHLRGYVKCRFTPTCSAYGREAVRKYGFAKGSWMAVKRIARCNPWTKMGTVDYP